MVKFSCFNAHMLFHKAKKTGQLSAPEAIDKMSQIGSHIQAPKDLPDPKNLNLLFSNDEGDSQINTRTKHLKISSMVEPCLNLEETNNKLIDENNLRVHQKGCIKKSQSHGCDLYREGRIYGDNNTEGETDQGFSCDGSHDLNRSVMLDGSKDPELSQSNHYGRDLPSEYFRVSSDLVKNESIFSIGDGQYSEKDTHENSDTPVSGMCAGDYGDRCPRTPHFIVKSYSLPSINACRPTTEGHSPLKYIAPRSRSSEDLHIRDIRQKDITVHEAERQVTPEQERDHNIWNTAKSDSESPVYNAYKSYSDFNIAKDYNMPVMGELNTVKNLKGDYPVHQRDEFPSKDFKIKRIEEWVTDLQLCSPGEETNELSHFKDQVNRGSSVNDLTVAKVDVNVGPGMEAAKRYISSLSTVATTAQLGNHGLVVIPFLSIFVSLRVLNLSGNAIVRITASALPRGLHMLNLSKNHISTIEGLRELSRLRVLDLSYNRILRIGHGLASCSSLKELYLAGNKISEVEGLHRLLKLNVLDLRFNKISTAKCLGQLAANYSSLHTISLEGNPAQKNVGDEQLKKYLQGLLPYLTYFNKQQLIKVSTSKDATDRSIRLGINAHQFDRGLRSDHKTARKSGHGLTSYRPSSSSTHGRKSQAAVASPKLHRGRHGRLPPTGTKATNHYFDFGSKLMNSTADISRSRSEGTLGPV